MNPMNKDIRLLSLFSGCGGLDLGFEGGFDIFKKCVNPQIHPDWLNGSSKKNIIKLPETRFKTIFANDIFPAAKAAWVSYFSNNGNSPDDFKLESIVDLVKKNNSKNHIFPKAEIVTGGFPCQDFSVAGKRNGFNSHKSHNGDLLSMIDNPTEENRGKLYMWMKKVIEIVEPKVFIAENVKGLISLSDTKAIIENDFRNVSSGYVVVDAQVLYAPSYGVPQTRERIFFIGFKKSCLTKEALKALTQEHISPEFNPYPIPTHGSNETLLSDNKKLLAYVTTSDVLNDLSEPESSNDLSHQSFSKAKWYGKHCQGQTEIDLGGLGPTIRSEHHGNIEFRRLAIEHGGKYHHEINSGLKERRLSVRECARIQTFPDNFEFVRKPENRNDNYKISVSDGYRLVGNAVPPLLGYHIATRLQELWPKLWN